MNGLKPADLALILLTVAMISAGQVLFKLVALRANEQHGYCSFRVISLLFVALVVYGAATLIWIRVLQTVPLSLGYIFMSLSFVLVPTAGMLFFHEALSLRFVIGAIAVVIGVTISAGR